MDISGLFKSVVPITLFNKGKASQLFSRVQGGETLLVIKNNSPVAVILSQREYEILRELSKACTKNLENGNTLDCEEILQLLERLKLLDEIG